MAQSETTGADKHPTDADTRHTVVATSVGHVIEAGAGEADQLRLFEQLGLTERRRFDFEQRLAEADVVKVLAELGAHDLDVGLDAATSPGGHFSPVWHFARAAEVVADLFDIADTYFWLIWTRLKLQVVVETDEVTIVVPPVPDHPGAHVLLRYLVAELIWSGQHHFAARPMELRRVVLPGPPTRRSDAWRRCTGVVPRFGAPAGRIVVSRAALDIPCRQPDPALASWLRYVLERRAGEIPARMSTEQEVAEQLRRRLSRPPTRSAVAAALGLTARTLARRLSAEGTTFQEVIDQVRFEAAQGLLPERSVAEVSERLGFADARSFQRAFRRWSGTTPRAWADQLSSGGFRGSG